MFIRRFFLVLILERVKECKLAGRFIWSGGIGMFEEIVDSLF